jgi:5'-deoxynucleotidase YfbR-like HD superfamily hydrolase
MLTLTDQLRAGHVNRWQIVQTARPQTLAEHSYHVCALAGELALLAQWPGLDDPHQRLELIFWAMYHDLIEVKTGDLATPFKECLRQAGGAEIVQEAERIADEEYSEMHARVRGTPIGAIVKIADMIEAAYFLQDNGLGSHAQEVLANIYRSIRELANDSVEDFPDLHLYHAAQLVCERVIRERVFL